MKKSKTLKKGDRVRVYGPCLPMDNLPDWHHGDVRTITGVTKDVITTDSVKTMCGECEVHPRQCEVVKKTKRPKAGPSS